MSDTEFIKDFLGFEPKDAVERMKKYIEVYHEFDLGDISVEEVKELLKDGKAYYYGKDKQGNPCLIIKAKKMFPTKDNIKLYIQMVYYNLQIGLKLAKEYFYDAHFILALEQAKLPLSRTEKASEWRISICQ